MWLLIIQVHRHVQEGVFDSMHEHSAALGEGRGGGEGGVGKGGRFIAPSSRFRKSSAGSQRTVLALAMVGI